MFELREGLLRRKAVPERAIDGASDALNVEELARRQKRLRIESDILDVIAPSRVFAERPQ